MQIPAPSQKMLPEVVGCEDKRNKNMRSSQDSAWLYWASSRAELVFFKKAGVGGRISEMHLKTRLSLVQCRCLTRLLQLKVSQGSDAAASSPRSSSLFHVLPLSWLSLTSPSFLAQHSGFFPDWKSWTHHKMTTSLVSSTFVFLVQWSLKPSFAVAEP